jgi:hypothetical protein
VPQILAVAVELVRLVLLVQVLQVVLAEWDCRIVSLAQQRIMQEVVVVVATPLAPLAMVEVPRVRVVPAAQVAVHRVTWVAVEAAVANLTATVVLVVVELLSFHM